MPIRILLADDHTIMRQGLRQILEHEADFAIVAEAGSGLEAIEQAIDGDESSRREISTKVDEGSIAARRILRNLIKSELEVA